MAWLENPFRDIVHPPNFGFNYSYAATRLVFDPSNSGRLYMGTAEGLFKTTPSAYAGQTTPAVMWVQQNKGAPGIVLNDLVRNESLTSFNYNNMLFV